MNPLGPFELEEQLHAGEEAWIWRAVHSQSKSSSIIRVYEPRPERLPADWFFKLVSTWRPLALLDHPNLLGVYDYGLVDEAASKALGGKIKAGCSWFAEEDLGDAKLQDHRPQTWTDCRRALIQILDGLAHLHGRHLLHGAIRPDQIRVDEEREGQLKLGGFAIGPEHRLLVLEGPLPGLDAAYSAPEIRQGDWREVGPQADLYSVGAVAWWMIFGEPPPEENPQWREPAITLPRAIGPWIRSLLAADPKERLQSARQARETMDLINQRPKMTLTEPPRMRPEATLPPHQVSTNQERHLAMGLRLHGHREMALFGREAEQNHLWSALQQTFQTGRIGYVRMTGKGGVGKNLLARWIAREARSAGVAEVIEISHPTEGGGRSGIAGALRHHLRCGGLEPEEVLERCKLILKALGAGQSYEWQSLTQLLAPDSRVTRVQFDGPRQRYRTMEVLLRRLAQERPILLVIDDVHLGSDVLALVSHMVNLHRMDGFPLLIISTEASDELHNRPAEAKLLGDLASSAQVTTLPILPLSDQDFRYLLQRGLKLNEQALQELSWRCEGDLFFALELVKDCADRRLLVVDEQGVGLRPEAHDELPAHLHEMWQARVERTLDLLDQGNGDASRQCLELAALLGQEVGSKEWSDACQLTGLIPPEGLISALEANSIGQRIDDGFRFDHALMVESMIKVSKEEGRLEALADNSLRVLEKAAKQDGDDLRLARHLERRGKIQDAIGPLANAASQSINHGVFAQAEALLAHRRRLLSTGAESKPDGKQLVLEAKLMLFQGQLLAASQALDSLENQIDQELDLRAQCSELQALVLERRGDRRGISEALNLAISAHEQGGDREGVLRCRAALARHHRSNGDLRDAGQELHHMQQGLEELPGSQELLANDLYFEKGALAQTNTDLSAATQAYAESLRLAEALGHQGRIGRAVMSLAGVARMAQDPARAEAWYRRALQCFERLGSDQSYEVQVELAFLLLTQRRLTELRSVIDPLLANLSRLGDESLLGQVQALNLVLAGHDQDWNTFDDAFAELRRLRLDRGVISPDTARALSQAGDHALQNGQAGRAREALVAALSQWTPLNRHEEVRVIEDKLAGLL